MADYAGKKIDNSPIHGSHTAQPATGNNRAGKKIDNSPMYGSHTAQPATGNDRAGLSKYTGIRRIG